jgi:selenide,water dikinase
MMTLNRDAAEAALRRGVRCATDVTGFGLAGHALAVARASGVTIEIDVSDLPLLPVALDLAVGFQASGLKANRRQFEPGVDYRSDPGEDRRALLFDPQTSGGLLLFVPPTGIGGLLAELPAARVIGRAKEPSAAPLVVR